MLTAGEGRSVAEGLDYVATWNAGFLASDDLVEAMTAFLEKRPAELHRSGGGLPAAQRCAATSGPAGRLGFLVPLATSARTSGPTASMMSSACSRRSAASVPGPGLSSSGRLDQGAVDQSDVGQAA